MALHVTLIGPKVDSKKHNEDDKGGDNGIWQKDHCASSTVSPCDSAPSVASGVGVGSTWYNVNLNDVKFDGD
jgi:hypothetical protein